jgi:CRP/FNR family transcriptional regulator
MDFLDKNPDILRQFTKRIVRGLSGLLTNVQNFLFGSIHHRILSVLRMLAKRFGTEKQSGEIFIMLPLTHEDISHMIGATREATSVELLQLARAKMISYKQQHITIHMMEKIERELSSDQISSMEEHGL